MTTPKIPLKQTLRKCVGCNKMLEKCTLIRVVKSKEGEINIDLTSKASGRGAYLCNSIECFDKAQKTRAVERAFKQKIDIEIYDAMRNQICVETIGE